MTSRSWSNRFKALIKERTGQGVPAGSVEAALGRRRRRVRFLDERPRDRLSPQIQHPLRVGHRRQRAGDGLWQHRRQLRFRRRVHPQPGQRRERFLRRIPHQRPGRRRRRRRAHARTRGAAQEPDARRPSRNWKASARPSKSTSRTCRTSSSPSRTARCSCSRPATASAPALAALKFCHRHGEGEAHRLEDRHHARNPADQLDQLLAPVFDREAVKKPPSASPRVCPPVPAPPPARFISTPTARTPPPPRARKCSSSALKRRPKTCAA